MDVINLSLGNDVNGPDYPTSIAVNRAADYGVTVVTANGNAGPENWTVGSPATASKTLAIGASTSPQHIPFLYEPAADKSIPLVSMMGARSEERRVGKEGRYRGRQAHLTTRERVR